MRLLTSTSISYVLVQASERRFMRKFDVPDSGLGFRSEYAILFNPFVSGYARLLNHDRLLSFSTALYCNHAQCFFPPVSFLRPSIRLRSVLSKLQIDIALTPSPTAQWANPAPQPS